MNKPIIIFTVIAFTFFGAANAQQDDFNKEERIEITINDVPSEVRTAINSKYNGWEVLSVYHVAQVNNYNGSGNTGNTSGTDDFNDQPDASGNNPDTYGNDQDAYDYDQDNYGSDADSFDHNQGTYNNNNNPNIGNTTGQANTNQQTQQQTKVKKPQTNNRNDNRPDNPSYESVSGTAKPTTVQKNNTGNTSGQNNDNWSGGTYEQNGGAGTNPSYYEISLMKGTEVVTAKFDEYGNEL